MDENNTNITPRKKKKGRKLNKRAKKIVAAAVVISLLGGMLLQHLLDRFVLLKPNTLPEAADVVPEQEEFPEEPDTLAEEEENLILPNPSGLYPQLIRSEMEDFPFCLYIPSQYEAGKTYPMMVYLHGAGERGTDNILQTGNASPIPYLTDIEYYRQHPCIILAPQCPEDEWWVDVLYEEERSNYSIDETTINPYLQKAMELIDKVVKEFPVDTDRIYVSGVSMGGYASWDAIERFPDKFAAAVILCGGGDPSAANRIKGVPIRFFHGAKDDEVPVETSRQMNEALIEAGARDAVYKEYDDIGHWIWMVVWEEDGLLDWIFEQSKDR